MRFWRWYTFLVIVCSIVAGTIYWWPQQPMWSHEKLDIARGFIKNGTQVLSKVRGDEPSFFILDTETGVEQGRFTLEYQKDWRFSSFVLVPERNQLVVGLTYYKPGTSIEELQDSSIVRPMVYQVIDAITGKSIAGPFTSSYYYDLISPNGKYFWSTRSSPPYGCDLIETHTGKVLYEARGDATRQPHHSIAFAPDSSACAMLWFSGMKCTIEIMELPSTRTRFIYQVPIVNSLYGWGWLQSWTDRLYLAGQIRIDQSSWLIPTYSFQVDADKLSDMKLEPLREEYERHHDHSVHVKDLGNKLVEVTYGYKVTASTAYLWVADWMRKFGFSLQAKGNLPLAVKTIDKASGKTLSYLSAPDLVSMWSKLSPDGTRLASWHPLKGLLMWDTQPTSRWPWALGSALLVVLLLQYLRYRFTRNASSAGTSCSPAS